VNGEGKRYSQNKFIPRSVTPVLRKPMSAMMTTRNSDKPAPTSSRQKEILDILLRHGWDYMRQLLTIGKPDRLEIPPPAILRHILTDLGPVYVKLGQLLSTRPDLLPPEYIGALSSLQSNVPPVPPEAIEAAIQQQLPQPPEAVFQKIDYQAIAAGSIAQTHRATLKDGRPVAIKIQRPGIDMVVMRDIELIRAIAGLMAGTDFGKRYDIVGLADEFAQALRAELDFTQEANYTERLRNNLAKSYWFDPKQLVVPEIQQPLTTPKMLVMEWLNGVPILSATLQGKNYNGNLEAERQTLTTLVFRSFFQQYLVDGFFHADPHPGNLFYLDDGRVAILDCGMMGHLDPRTQSALVELVLAILALDSGRCTQLTLQLAEATQPVDLARLAQDYDRLLRKYNNLSLANLNTSEAFYEILQAARRNNLRWPANIGLFAKSLANLEGVARQFNPAVNVVTEIQPLMTDMFQRQLLGNNPLQAILRTALEFKNLSLESPRQFGFLLDRLTSETLKLNLNIENLEALRRSQDDAANRRSFSTVVGSLAISAAIISTGAPTPELKLLSNILFGVASFLGLWLVVKILKSGQFP
jgi:predicted unusual protein kinase regulating ubiquinone biosynthesis (AarF/ABC1/UbiB family)